MSSADIYIPIAVEQINVFYTRMKSKLTLNNHKYDKHVMINRSKYHKCLM